MHNHYAVFYLFSCFLSFVQLFPGKAFGNRKQTRRLSQDNGNKKFGKETRTLPKAVIFVLTTAIGS